MTLAASLERFGITPTVVEIADGALSRGLALMLTSNVCLALRRVGLEDAVIERGITLERIVHRDPSGDLAEDPWIWVRRMHHMGRISGSRGTA